MLKYITKRILLFIPSLFAVTLAGFVISLYTPGDPVMRLLGAENEDQRSAAIYDKQYFQLQHQLGLDLPIFYFTLTNAAMPEAVEKVRNRIHRDYIKSLSLETGNGDAVISFYNSVVNSSAKDSAASLFYLSGVNETEQFLHAHSAVYSQPQVAALWEKVKANSSAYNKWFPVIRFNGYNQYHRWLFGDREGYFHGILSGDFGRSLVTGKKISAVISEKIKWTLLFTLSGILIALLIAIPTGIIMAVRSSAKFDRWSSKILLLIHALPSFFIATVLLMIFANPSVLGWLPASGTGPVSNTGTITFAERIPYFILPLICYILGSLPFLVRSVRGRMMEELQKEYIITARSKGLSDKNVLYHALRNSLIPLITLCAWVFPAMISGSAVIETIFSIPGMGLEIVQAVFARDYPMLITVFTLTGVFTITGYLISDLLYMVADPRIELQ